MTSRDDDEAEALEEASRLERNSVQMELKEQEAYFAQPEILKFVQSKRYEFTPLNVARANGRTPNCDRARWTLTTSGTQRNSGTFAGFCRTLCAIPSSPHEIDKALNGFLEEFWNASQVEDLCHSLVAARGRALLHGRTQHWIDPETDLGYLGNLQAADIPYIN
jgi:hypothetical protein